MKIISRKALRNFVHSVFYGLMNVHISGLENVPLTGGAILATNHLSRLDTPLLLIAVDRDDLSAFVTDKYIYNPLFALFVNVSDSIWINRDIADYKAMREGLNLLKGGGMLGIAPEGTRSHNGKLLQAKSGTSLIAEKAGVPIIPVGIHGTEDTMYRLRRFKRPEVHANFGSPFTLDPIDRNNRELSLQINTEEIMCQIAALLPPQNRGFYENHPRLLELSKGSNL